MLVYILKFMQFTACGSPGHLTNQDTDRLSHPRQQYTSPTHILGCGHGGREERDGGEEVLEGVEEGEKDQDTLRHKRDVRCIEDDLWAEEGEGRRGEGKGIGEGREEEGIGDGGEEKWGIVGRRRKGRKRLC